MGILTKGKQLCFLLSFSVGVILKERLVALTILLSEWPKLNGVLAILRAIGLKSRPRAIASNEANKNSL